MSCSLIEKLTDEAIDQVVAKIYHNIQSPVELVNQVCTHLIASGGKRIRPRLMILCAGLIGGLEGVKNEDVIDMAAAIEIIHTSTLMHDDVIDESSARRGHESTNYAFGNSLAVLGGDYLFTKAFCMANEVNSPEHRIKICSILADAIGTLVQGEIEQMQNIADTKLSEETYFKTIYAKTAILFEVSARISAVLSHASPQESEQLALFGRALGNAFQIADDIMDYTSSATQMGKNIGDDLNEEKMTLPLIYLLNSALKTSEHEKILAAFKNHDIETITTALKTTDAIERCQARAQKEVDQAIEALASFAPSAYKDALIMLVRHAAYRSA